MNNQEKISSLCTRLQEALDLKKMKAIDLSNATGIPKGSISYYLSGKFTPKGDRLHIISKTLGVSEAWLLGFDVPRNRTSKQIQNDQLLPIITRLRVDEDFFETVSAFAELTEEEAHSIKQLLSVLRKK